MATILTILGVLAFTVFGVWHERRVDRRIRRRLSEFFGWSE